MMMPILDQSPAHHHHHHQHGHGHQAFFHQQHLPDQTGKMQLTLILPNGVPSVISVDANTPMMDLLVQAASSNKLNPSGYSLVVLDSNQHVIHFKPNQTVGQIVKNCQLPQINGSSTISLLPKETLQSHPSSSSSKAKTQPFEITVRLQVNLPDAQKILLRVDPTLPLFEIKEQICKQKKYQDSHRYTFRLPTKIDQNLLLGLSLAEYKTNELTLVYLRQDPKTNPNQLQSFDRLYRTRSESQPPNESNHDSPNEGQDSGHNRQRPASVQLNANRSPSQNPGLGSLPGRPTHPVTSHTSLHAYWNDPNFDTQSQVSDCSSTTKKRRAPQPPGQTSPMMTDQQAFIVQSTSDVPAEHHESHESLTENGNGAKQKRKAPVLLANQENTTESDVSPSVTVTKTTEHVEIHSARPESTDDEAKPRQSPSPKLDITLNPADEQRLLALLAEQQTPPQARLVITTQSPEPHSSTPIYSQIQKNKDISQSESPYSTVKSTPTPPMSRAGGGGGEAKSSNPTPTYSVVEIVQAGIAEPPQSPASPVYGKPIKSSKKSASTDGLLRIVNDHRERADAYQANDQSAENVSYFRVAKSRHGKFETENAGFVSNTTGIFDTTNKRVEQPATTTEKVFTTVHTSKPAPAVSPTQSKGKQAYDLLKKYEKEDEHGPAPTIDTDYLKTITVVPIHDRDKSPTPIQLEVTERTTHISVTVESDRKQLITRSSPVPQITSTAGVSGPPPILAPKPFGKTITEYRTVRRLGSDGETKTTTTVRTETIPPADSENKESTVTETHESHDSGSAAAAHDSVMESIRADAGSPHLDSAELK